MSLTVSLNLAQSSLSLATRKMAVVSNNITNADQAGYTRKTYQASYTTAGSVTMPTGGQMQGHINLYLTKTLIAQASDAQRHAVLADYLSTYSGAFGGTDGSGTTLGSALDSLLASLQSAIGGETASKSTIIGDAQAFVSQMNQLSNTIQDQRAQADQEIKSSVNTINQALTTLEKLNAQITTGNASNSDTADLEDQRMTALKSLSEQIGIQYYFDSNNALCIYTQGGDTLLTGSGARQLSYSATSGVSSATTYPGGFSGIMLAGKDITTSSGSGKLGGLIELRDSTLPGEQAKLDALANTAGDALNRILNQGASLPPRNTLTSAIAVAGTDVFSATGTVRIALGNSSGTVQSVTDLDLSTYATIDELMDAIDNISGISASIDASTGKLVVSADDSTLGVSMNEMNSSVGGDGKGFSTYFGFNNFFDGSGAEHMQVSSYLLASSNALATGKLSDSATLAAGDRGIASGDVSILTALADVLGSNQSFATAGDFSAQTNTLSAYAGAILSTAASQASNASSNAENAQQTYDYLNDKLTSESGVNIDEETVNMTVIQNSYEATATLISTIRDMFEALIESVR